PIRLAFRRKTSQRPLGETAGSVSPVTGCCGYVNCLFSPDSSETTNKASGLPSPAESVTTTQLESGHQARDTGRFHSPCGRISPSLLSVPPSGGISRNSFLPASG